MTILRAASGTDWAGIEELLTQAGLPVPVKGEPVVEFVVADDGDDAAACAGWEIHEDHALLRSIAVDEQLRARGLGKRIVEEALRRLEDRDVRDVTLVTLDAERFFRRFGFQPIAREEVPGPVQASPEFRIHHCALGQWMRRTRG